MNALPDSSIASLVDVQSQADRRQVAIQQVGVRGVRHPVRVAVDADTAQDTVAQWTLTVALPAEKKATHMSRFMELLAAHRHEAMKPARLCAMAESMLDLLQAGAGDITVDFPYFIDKAAPVTGARGVMDYQVCWEAHARQGRRTDFSLRVVVPVTSLCPCSKAISRYGAHNQRSQVTVRLDYAAAPALDLNRLIGDIEACGSSQLWGLLKRADEKFVTEQAYENPKFVEDLVRDVAIGLRRLSGVTAFEVAVENFESIHNHSAYAVVRGGPQA